jgi:hypothetical protein
MIRQKLQLNRIGSLANFPNWRYLALEDPSRINMGQFYRKVKEGTNCLKRYIRRIPSEEDPDDIKKSTLSHQISISWSFPDRFQRVIDRLSLENRTLFYKLFKAYLKHKKERKLFCMLEGKQDMYTFDFKNLDRLCDPFVCRFLQHVNNIIYDPYIAFALNLKNSKHHEYIFRAIGYYVFAGVSDIEIAKRFKFYPKQMTAVRNLFYDFSNCPSDPMARKAYFTQLLNNADILEEDIRFYRICGEMGETGLKALSNYHGLTGDEKIRVEEYLGNSMIDNVLALHFSTTSTKDAINFNTVINNLASFYIKKEEVNYFRAKVRNLDASTSRIENDKSSTFTGFNSDDQAAMELITSLALKENLPPSYKTITQLDN